MLNIASLGMRFNLHNVKCRFARYAFKKSMPHSRVPAILVPSAQIKKSVECGV